jgi:hypothetical protein
MSGEYIQSEISVSQKMIDAGINEAREHLLGAPLSDLVTKIYIAMALEAQDTSVSASDTSARR